MHTKNAYFQQVTTQGNILHIDTNPLGISYPGANAFDSINENPFLPHHLNHDKKYSPPVSPSGYSSCNSSSGHGSPRKDIPHNKCHLIRRNTKSNSIASPTISAQSWDHIKSPAASFLASFASPPPSSLPSSLGVNDQQEEQDGDELDDYVLEKVIGHGGFSRVRSGYCISDGRKVAVKVTSQERELAIWKQLDHPHVLSMEKLLETESGMCYAVCTYCGGGTLLDLVQQKQQLEESEARCIVRQLTSALEYLHHDARVVHKDLKLDNVLLLDDKKTVKLGDFGLAVFQQPIVAPTHDHDNKLEYAGGSLAYTAPEQIRTPWVISSPSTDMWSLGILLYALVAGRLPFDDSYDARLQQKILSGDFEMPPHISPPLASLISGLLHVDPSQRLTARQVLDSAWCNMTT